MKCSVCLIRLSYILHRDVITTPLLAFAPLGDHKYPLDNKGLVDMMKSGS